MVNGKQVWKVTPGVRFRRLFDEAVLIREHDAEALVLNDTAASFIERCDGKLSVEEIIVSMTSDFEVSTERLTQDLEPFIIQLAEEGVIDDV